MADIINLRTMRKRKKREDRDKVAENNRVLHGRPKSERDMAKNRASLESRKLDGHRLRSGFNEDEEADK